MTNFDSAMRSLQLGPRVAVFTTVARCGSFSAAARALGLSKSTVSAHITELEQHLDMRLLERTSRTVRVTEDGQAFLDRANELLEAWDTMLSDPAKQRDLGGMLRVTANHYLGEKVMVPTIVRFAERHPNVRVDLLLDDSRHDLVSEGIDLALRVGPLEDSTLVTARLGRDREVLIASPSLVPDPRAIRPSDLAELPWVCHSRLSVNRERIVRGPNGASLRLRMNPRATASSGAGLLGLVEGGVGIALMPTLFTVDAVARGSVVYLLPRWAARDVEVHALYPSRKHVPLRLTAFLELLREEVSQLLDRAKHVVERKTAA